MSRVRARVLHGLRTQIRLLVVLLVLGVLLALAWRLLAPTAAALGDDEPAASVDGTLVLLGLPLGALTAAFVLLRPGAAPVDRALAAIVGSVLGALISWQLGDRWGTPALRATGAAFTWPVATATVIFLGALLPGTSRRLQTGRPGVPPMAGPFSDRSGPSGPM